MNERGEYTFNPKLEAETRLKKLDYAIDTLKNRINEDKKQKIKGLLFLVAPLEEK